MEQTNIIQAIDAKYIGLGENPDNYLKGLLHSKPLNYWDYVEVDTLLSLQKPRTNYKDEESFIIYNQVTELILKLILNEIKQISGDRDPSQDLLIEKLYRLNHYTELLIHFFGTIKIGINYEDYNVFRTALTPASGFQSAQFRYIELYSTSLDNLINQEGKKRLAINPTVEEYFDHIYWKDAGINKKTGKKTLTMNQFEEKYLEHFISVAKKNQGNTLENKINRLQNPSYLLEEKLREFDHLYNIKWPLVHLNIAKHYLDKKGENKEATGGSDWKKYLHPQYQQRKFFPTLWTEVEINQWGKVESK